MDISQDIIDRIRALCDKIDDKLSEVPLETDHGHHVDKDGWLKGWLRD